MSGRRIYSDLCDGLWPIKENVYRYPKRYLSFEDFEVKDAIDSLLSSECPVRNITKSDLGQILKLKAKAGTYAKELTELEEKIQRS